MTDEIINEQEVEQDPIDIIEDLRANTVSKAEFDKLKAQNNKLLSALAKGETIAQPAPKVDKDALRKALYSQGATLTNLEYVDKTLQLRKAIIDEGGVDPFLPNGTLIAPTQEDINAAKHLADTLQECVDYAEGDSSIFTNELQRRTRDVRIR